MSLALLILPTYSVATLYVPNILLMMMLFLHDSRDCPETAVLLLHQKRLGSGSEPTKEKIKLLKNESGKNVNTDNVSYTSKFV